MFFHKSNMFPSLFIFGFSIIIAFSALRLKLGSVNEPGPGFIPFLAAVLLFVLSFLLFLHSIKRRINSSVVSEGAVQYRKIIFLIAILFGYSLLLDVLGFYLITFVFMFILFIMESKKSLVSALIGGILTTIFVYIFFELFLDIHFPRGIFIIWFK